MIESQGERVALLIHRGHGSASLTCPRDLEPREREIGAGVKSFGEPLGGQQREINDGDNTRPWIAGGRPKGVKLLDIGVFHPSFRRQDATCRLVETFLNPD